MPRPPLTVNEKNFNAIYNYIRENVYKPDMSVRTEWADSFQITGKLQFGTTDFLAVPPNPFDFGAPEALQQWCNRYLNAHKNSREWNKIKDAIRAKRKRTADKKAGISKQSVSLEPYAHLVITDVAEREGLTASEVIEKYIGPAFDKHWNNKRKK